MKSKNIAINITLPSVNKQESQDRDSLALLTLTAVRSGEGLVLQ